MNYRLGYKLQQCVCNIQVMYVHEEVSPGAITQSSETWAKALSLSDQVLDNALNHFILTCYYAGDIENPPMEV